METNSKFEHLDITLFTGKNPQEKAFEHGKKMGHTFYVQMDILLPPAMIQSKGYGSYRDIKHFWKATQHIAPEEKAIYEIIREDVPCKFFADIEWNLDNLSKDEVLTTFKKVVLDGFEQTDYVVNTDDLLIMDACNETKRKGSLHVVHPDVYFENLHDQKRYWSNVKTIMEQKYPKMFFQEETEHNYINKTFIDFCVYTKNRAFRLPYSSKMKNGDLERPLIPDNDIPKYSNVSVRGARLRKYIITAKTTSSSFVNVSELPVDLGTIGKRSLVPKTLIQSLADTYDVEVGSIRKNLITLKNKGIRQCPLSGGTHHSNNAYLQIKQGKIYYKCLDEDCKNKKVCVHTLHDDELYDDIPWDEYTALINDAIKAPLKPADDASDEVKTVYTKKLGAISKQYNKVVYACLEDLNKYICAITGSSKPYFMTRKVAYDELGNKYIYYVRQLKQGLRDTFENRWCPPNPCDKKSGGLWISAWLAWKDRKSFDSEVFQSGDCPSTQFNTFKGFNINKDLAFERGTKSISGFLDFIKIAWCGGDTDLYNWVLDWMAHLIQRPLVKMSSTLVLCGEEGIGKGMVLQKLKEVIGSHLFCQPSHPSDILGNFNSILDRKAFLFLDELVWGGDKEKAGILKKLITEKEGTINEKGIPQRRFINCANIAMASNEDWVAPAGNNARRFQVISVKNTLLDKSAVYDCCPYSLAKFLYTRDISKFQHDKIIATQGLAFQKELTAHNSHKFWLNKVRESDLPFNGHITFDTLFADFKSIYGSDKYTTIQSFSKQLKSVVDYKIYKPHGGRRQMAVPSYEECRKHLNTFFKQNMFEEADMEVIETD